MKSSTSKLPQGQPPPNGLESVLESLGPHFATLDRYLEEQVACFEPEVQPLVRFTLGHSGKKLRPMLVFLSGWNENTPPGEDLVRAAAIVELVHLATLVHDDILDEADLRHQTETVKARYDPHSAVLLGDALFAHALHLATDYSGNEVCRAVSAATRQVCSGEIAQTFARGNADLTYQSYYRMIDLKTAELFVVSAYLGTLLSGGTEEIQQASQEFARHLGIAYQIFDDCADLLGEERKAGKTLGTDLASGKFTLPFLVWFESLGESKAAFWKKQLLEGGFDVNRLPEIMAEESVFTSVQATFEMHIHEAEMALKTNGAWAGAAKLAMLSTFVRNAWNKLPL